MAAKVLTGKRYWLVGASEGLGRALAAQMSAQGAEVIASARDGERLASLKAEGHCAEVIAVDVTSAESVAAAAAAIGHIDGLVWLVGAYWPMRAQDFDTEKVLAMIDTNLSGAVRVIGAVLPGFLAQGRGHIVITGSLSGYRGLPGAIGYAASKGGLMHLAEDMYADLRGTGVRVQLAIPGFIKTRLTEKNDFKMPQIMAPDVAADHILRLMQSRRFARAFPAPFSWVFRLGNFLPDGLYYRLFAPKRDPQA